MEIINDEGLRRVNNIPLPIECLIMSGHGVGKWGNRIHYHDYIEILYVLEGEYEVKADGNVTFLEEHSMFVLNARELHSTRKASEHQTLLCIKFLPQVLYSSEQSVTELEYSIPYVFENFSKCRKFSSELLKGTAIPGIFEDICREKREMEFGYELALRAQTLRVFLWIIRYWHEQAGKNVPMMPNRNAAVMLGRVRDYVKEYYTSANAVEAARICGVSYGYFSRTFNECMKMKFSDYVNRVRINQSVQLLATTNLSITDIALSTGFSTSSYYIEVFKKYKSISPKRFRMLVQGSEAGGESIS